MPCDAPVMIATFCESGIVRPDSSDEVGFVDHATGLTAADADEDALVDPVELGCRGFDLGRGPEGVFAGVDVLAAPETGEDLGAAVANPTRLHVEQSAAVGLERVADVAECGPVRQDDLPVGAGSRKELSVDLRAGERPAGQRHDVPAASADVPEIQRRVNRGLQPVDLGQARFGELSAHALFPSVTSDRTGSFG